MKKASLWIVGEQKAEEGRAAAFAFTVLTSVSLTSDIWKQQFQVKTSYMYKLAVKKTPAHSS